MPGDGRLWRVRFPKADGPGGGKACGAACLKQCGGPMVRDVAGTRSLAVGNRMVASGLRSGGALGPQPCFQAVPWIQGRGGGRIPCRSCAAVRACVTGSRGPGKADNGARKAKGHREGGLLEFGAGEESRTPDLRITNALLYQLSYTGLVLSLRF